MMQMKKTFTFTLPNTQAIPIDDANDLTLEIEDDDQVNCDDFVDEVVEETETVKLEEPIRDEFSSCEDVIDSQSCELVIDMDRDLEEVPESIPNPEEKAAEKKLDHEEEKNQDNKQSIKEVINYKMPVYKCTMEKCEFTTNVEKYLHFHLERHKLYDKKKDVKCCHMCKQFKTTKLSELTSHRMVCPNYEKYKKYCTFPECTYVTFKLKQMNVHVEKYHSNNANVRNPFIKGDKGKKTGKRKNKTEEKSGKKLKNDKAAKAEEPAAIKEQNETDSSKLDDTDEDTLKIDESYQEPPDDDQEQIKKAQSNIVAEQERQNMEEAAIKRNIDEQIENTINLLCDITKSNNKAEEFCPKPQAEALLSRLESTDEDIDRQMQENAMEDNNSLLDLMDSKDL